MKTQFVAPVEIRQEKDVYVVVNNTNGMEVWFESQWDAWKYADFLSAKIKGIPWEGKDYWEEIPKIPL